MPKIIRCNPKTGSTWLALALTEGPVIALHDAVNGCYNLDDYREKIEIFEGYYNQVIDVTTAPMFIAEQLGEIVYELDVKLFDEDSDGVVNTVLDIAEYVGHIHGLYLPRLYQLLETHASSKEGDVDVEAGVALWNSLR